MLTTLIHRPYVFMFLIAFLVLGRIYWGWRNTFLWLIIGYVVAWASEFSSIHNGFPYGMYHYIYENMQGELMVFGVPFWDSLSYPFMIFAGYTTARFIIGIQNPPSPPFTKGGLGGIYIALLGAFLTMLLDIIIDPLTVLGDRWFLGKVYYYPDPGWYFGVPLSNFAGWFLVPLVVILVFQLTSRLDPLSNESRSKTIVSFLNPLFYLSIAIFNIAITMMIGEALLASIDCLILIPIVGLLILRIKTYALSTA